MPLHNGYTMPADNQFIAKTKSFRLMLAVAAVSVLLCAFPFALFNFTVAKFIVEASIRMPFAFIAFIA
jgi:hypothetical protein